MSKRFFEQNLFIDGIHLAQDERVIHLWSDQPLAVTSSSVVGGELESTRHILNMQVEKNYNCAAPAEDLNALAHALGIHEPFVGMMTAARLERIQVIVEHNEETTVLAMVTVGLSHPVAAGIVGAQHAVPLENQPGTINAILVIDAKLPRAARVNAIISATEAKTLALVEAKVRAPHGGFASGTATDAIVMATTERGVRYEYAGPLTPVGAMIARAMRRAIQNAAQ